MERKPSFQADDSGNKDSGSDKKSSGGFNVVPAPQFNTAERVPTPPPVERRSIPVAPAFEGVISWRDRGDEDLRAQHPDSEVNKPTDTKENDKDEAKDKDKTKSSKQSTVQQPEPQTPQPVVERPRPLDEVISEALPAEQARQDGEENEATDEASIPEGGVFAFPQPPKREYDPIRRSEQAEPAVEPAQHPHQEQAAPIFAPGTLASYPPVAPRQEAAPAQASPEQQTAPNESDAASWQPEATHLPGHVEYAPVSAEATTGEHEAGDDEQTANLTTIPGYAPGVGPTAGVNYNQAPPAATVPGHNPNAIPFIQLGGNQQPPVPGAGGPNQPPINPNIPPMGGGNLPPNQPGYNPNLNPYSPYNPANMGTGPDFNAAPAAPIMPLERPSVPGANRDSRVGPLAALLGLEYLARKRADRKLEKRLNKRSDVQFKQQERQTGDQQIRLQEQQRQFAAEQARQGREMNQMQYRQEAAPAAAPRPFEAAPSGVAPVAERSQPIASPNQQPRFYGQPERSTQQQNPELRPQAGPVQNAERQQPVAAEDIQDQPAIELKPNQRVEHSAWHNIVVDERGHEVAGAIEYGQGFQSERQQEAIRDRATDDGAGDDANAGAVGAGFGSMQQNQFGNPMLPSGMTNPTLPAGRSTHADPQHQLEARNAQASNFTNPWFWIMLLLIIAAFFTAALV